MTDEKRQAARVIEMRVRQHHRIDLLDWAGQSSILRVRVSPMSLEQAAVQQDGLTTGADDMTRPGYFARGAGKLDLH